MRILRGIFVTLGLLLGCVLIIPGVVGLMERLLPEPSDPELKEAVRLLVVDYTHRHSEKTRYRPDILSEDIMLSSGETITRYEERYETETEDGTWEPITWEAITEREKREKAASKARMAKLQQLAADW